MVYLYYQYHFIQYLLKMVVILIYLNHEYMIYYEVMVFLDNLII